MNPPTPSPENIQLDVAESNPREIAFSLKLALVEL